VLLSFNKNKFSNLNVDI